MIFFEWKIKSSDERKCAETLVRVTHFARKLKWQFRDEEGNWEYDREPVFEHWEKLYSQARARYQRGKLDYKILQLIERGLADARREFEAASNTELSRQDDSTD
jgi:hypothetical protein